MSAPYDLIESKPKPCSPLARFTGDLMKTETVRLPAFLASALINGDTSGLEERDMRWVDAAHELCAPGHFVSCDGEAWFAWSCDLPGFNLGCDVLDYTILYPEVA